MDSSRGFTIHVDGELMRAGGQRCLDQASNLAVLSQLFDDEVASLLSGINQGFGEHMKFIV